MTTQVAISVWECVKELQRDNTAVFFDSWIPIGATDRRQTLWSFTPLGDHPNYSIKRSLDWTSVRSYGAKEEESFSNIRLDMLTESGIQLSGSSEIAVVPTIYLFSICKVAALRIIQLPNGLKNDVIRINTRRFGVESNTQADPDKHVD